MIQRMKTITVLLMIYIVDQTHSEKVMLPSSCSFFTPDDGRKHQFMYLSTSTCTELMKDSKTYEEIQQLLCQQSSKDHKDCSDSTQIIFCATPTAATAVTPDGTSCDTNSSTNQSILIVLLVISVVLLAIVSTGWVWTCRAMKKKQGMKDNATNSEIQSINGSNTIQECRIDQPCSSKPNNTSIRHNQAHRTQLEEESQDGREYDVIPPLMHEITIVTDHNDSANVQTSPSTTQPDQQAYPECSQATTETENQTGLKGRESVLHDLESGAEAETIDKAEPYEVPIPSLMTSAKRQKENSVENTYK